ncbi:MarR family transcriptional regulator [Candidatus Thorarchaeota archaeon]|nr:MAG: MarR family transcriptional regulator [Candidatus Thorarchaeota archaeon]
MSVTAKSTLFVAAILILGLIASASPIDAQADSQNILMTNMRIHAELVPDCNTTIVLETEFTNEASTEISSFGIRVDVRGLYVNEATIDGLFTETTVQTVDNYVVVSIIPNTSIPIGAQGNLFLNFTTRCLQEMIGLNSDGSMYDSHLIYYIRSLNQIQNLTFSAALPQHAVIDLDAAAPLYPSPTRNHTDGSRSVYLWYTDVLLPGQEIVYIIKYQMPAALIDTSDIIPVTSSPLFVAFVSAVLAGFAVLFIERLPGWIRGLNSRELIVSGKISSQEQEILDLLNVRGGSCPQREIYEHLDMSQSMASMMLTSLEGRGLIKRLRSGRENIVHIMED